jgi:hypothetical protein
MQFNLEVISNAVEMLQQREDGLNGPATDGPTAEQMRGIVCRMEKWNACGVANASGEELDFATYLELALLPIYMSNVISNWRSPGLDPLGQNVFWGLDAALRAMALDGAGLDADGGAAFYKQYHFGEELLERFKWSESLTVVSIINTAREKLIHAGEEIFDNYPGTPEKPMTYLWREWLTYYMLFRDARLGGTYQDMLHRKPSQGLTVSELVYLQWLKLKRRFAPQKGGAR